MVVCLFAVCCFFWTMILENLQYEKTGVCFSSPVAGGVS